MEETSVAGDPGPDAGTSTAPNAAPEPVARRQRILFVGEAATLAHVVRPFVLARSLDPSRYEVHFACDPRFNKLLGPLPFPHHPIHTVPSEEVLLKIAQGRLFYNTRTLRKYIAADRKILNEIAPDVVVGDNRLSLSVSARLAGIPYIAIANAYGDYTLYADVPELVPTYNLPANHRYLGPVLWSPDVKPPTWWHSLPTDRPIIYATLGSSGGKNLLQVVLNALADLPVTVIAATAGRNHLKNVPANAFVADYLPGEAAAARSAVVLCNGGSPTTQQALAAGVPVIGLPSNMDQHLNMEALERAGAGVLLRTERLNTEGVAAAVKQVLSGAEFRQAARRLAEAFGPDFAGFPQHIESALRLVC